MRLIRVLVVIFLVVAIGLYGAGGFKENRDADPTLPSMSSDRDILEVTTDYTQEDLLEGLSAWDERDGDLTEDILVGDFSQFIQPGLCNLSYVVFDSSNQAATLSRQVQFTDYQSPKLTLSQPLVFTVGDDASVTGLVGATDMLDGDLSSLVLETGSDINTQEAGTYHVDVEVTNSFGDVEEQSLPVHVVEPGYQALSIELTSYIAYILAGETFDPGDYIQSLENVSGTFLDSGLIQTESSVDTQTPGCYEVHYYAENDAGQWGETWLTVIVRD
ncbi:hypothetical protein HNP82_001306 [Catenibacillus scindens]|uniref:Pesticidal crystal protein Cry22Aa Ig-like domain-containing protein n=1 Tax=Catenibacillus scindens TaxID=673271 RepID=A0A7W8H9M8_9FIRM|nr:immunoglobulin-like domain-containing protein [Catenibacillus scindens]MBB5264195.1 hypothetical protein [Catenibacillus scindens]